MRNALGLSLLCLAVSACGSTGGGGGASSSAAGTWTGQWLSQTGVGGSATMHLSAGGDGLTGTVSFSNSPCFSSGAVSATLDGETVSADVTAGAIEVTIDATITGTHMSGSYDAVSAGACTGDTGTFTATR